MPFFILLPALFLLILLPLAGVWLAGRDIAPYLEFPPVQRFVSHADFSWPVFLVVLAAAAAFIMPFVVRALTRRGIAQSTPAAGPFPWWGWLGIFLGLAAWVLAWTRFTCFASFRFYTFFPLWLSYILVVNAVTFYRTGHCLLKDRSRYFLLLFPTSAVFWWLFEYLNRFVQNWYYLGIGNFSALEYFLFSSLSFSTVLPAVLSTTELLESTPRVGSGLACFLRLNCKNPRPLGWAVLVVSGLGLAGIGIWPNYLFPLLWLAPLFIITSLQVIGGQVTILSSIRQGDWSRLYRLALAALICGFFWEMWNFFSAAKWVYDIPFVCRFKLFEMPILGYIGYLPFGLECGVIGDIFGKWCSKIQK